MKLELCTDVCAPVDRCFDLSRDLDLHRRSMAHTSEEAIAGRTTGLIELGEEVTWRGRHFGLMLEHTARITRFERPLQFRDEMVKGHFKLFVHDHIFEATQVGTRMRDVLEFRSPLGPIGALVDLLVLKRYLNRLLANRNDVIRREAEQLS